jgi:hypothetical protein
LHLLPAVSVCCGSCALRNVTALLSAVNVCSDSNFYRKFTVFTVCSKWGTRWRSWLRQCAASRKVTGSIPDVVIGFFHRRNPSGRTMVLGSTQPLTEISTRIYFLGVKGGRCLRLTTLSPSCADCLEIWEPEPPGTLRACPGM